MGSGPGQAPQEQGTTKVYASVYSGVSRLNPISGCYMSTRGLALTLDRRVRGNDPWHLGHEADERFVGECDADSQGCGNTEIVQNKNLGEGGLDGHA